MARRYGLIKDEYSTTEVGEVLTRVIGFSVTDQWVRALWLEALGSEPGQGAGKHRIPRSYATWMVEYTVMPHTYHSSKRKHFGKWLNENGHRLPKQMALVPVKKLKSVRVLPPGVTMEYVVSLEHRIAGLEKEISHKNTPAPKAKRITSKPAISLPRERIRRDMNSYISANGYDYGKVWGFCMENLAKDLGGFEPKAYSGHPNKSYLEYVEDAGLIGDFRKNMERWMTQMDEDKGNFLCVDTGQPELEFGENE